MIKTIEIKCSGSRLENINDLIHFQGDLKNLTEESYLKFKSEILELGFSEPISIWINDNKKYILNGHMRKITLNKMRDEGYEIPLIPVSIVEADDITQAKKKVLALTSQFGEITQDGLIDFCEKNMLNIDDMMKEFRFPEIVSVVASSIDEKLNNEVGIINAEIEESEGGEKKISICRRKDWYYYSFYKTKKIEEFKKGIYNASIIADIFTDLIEFFIRKKDNYYLITTPERSHTEKNGFHFASKVCEQVSEKTGIEFYGKAIVAKNKNKIEPEFKITRALPKDKTPILFDDVLTTGKTAEQSIIAIKKEVSELNYFPVFIAINNN